MNRKNQKISKFCIGVLVGFVLWSCYVFIFESGEPWDARPLSYVVTLLVAGCLITMLFPDEYLTAPLGLYLGQILFILIFLPSPFLMVGALSLIPYSLFSMLGAYLVFRMSNRIRGQGE
ncbi:MAG: hypothetical protein RIC91_03580 [Gammaproteobacteria bacterium]